MVIWVVEPVVFWLYVNVSEEHPASIFGAEVRGVGI
jgi:hypothetical protein